jgi:GT2 family glycosyltransferase
MPDVSMIVVNYRTYSLIDKFLTSYDYYRPTKYSSEVLVVDNETSDRAYSLSLPPNCSIEGIKNNIGYGPACNVGASLTDSKYIGLFNSDTYFVNDQCVDRCIDFLEENPDVGVVAPLQYSSVSHPRNITSAGVVGTHDNPKHRGWKELDQGQFRDVLEVVMVTGSVMFVRREAWYKIMLDPIFRKHWPDATGAMPEHFLYYEDTALCYAMPKFGYKVFHVGDQGAEMVHEWHKTIGNSYTGEVKKSQELFRSLMDDWNIPHN